MYQQILVAMALDHHLSQDMLRFAKTVGSEDVQITALHVLEEPAGTANARLREDLQSEGEALAKKIFGEKLAEFPHVTPKLVHGHVSRTILEYAKQSGTDCIIMGSHKPGMAEYFIGSTAARVVRHAHCSVHVYRT